MKMVEFLTLSEKLTYSSIAKTSADRLELLLCYAFLYQNTVGTTFFPFHAQTDMAIFCEK